MVAILGQLESGPPQVTCGGDHRSRHRRLADITRVPADNDQFHFSVSACAVFFSRLEINFGSRSNRARRSKYCLRGRAGVPQTGSPARTILDVRTPQPEPSTARLSMRALSPMPTWPPITARSE